MMRYLTRLAPVVLLVGLSAALARSNPAGTMNKPAAAMASAATTDMADDHDLLTPGEIKWGDAPPSLPRGARSAVLEGDPSKEGPFTMRLKVPDGYMIPPHWHSKVEHVTVISGTFNLGFGETVDKKAGRRMPAGSFAVMQPGMRHFAWATGETVVQAHGIGPWDINYVRPEDDPRKK